MVIGEEFSFERAISAYVIEQFSNRSGKRVELVEDNDGVFVRRIYGKQAVQEIERCNRPFNEAWDAYWKCFLLQELQKS